MKRRTRVIVWAIMVLSAIGLISDMASRILNPIPIVFVIGSVALLNKRAWGWWFLTLTYSVCSLLACSILVSGWPSVFQVHINNVFIAGATRSIVLSCIAAICILIVGLLLSDGPKKWIANSTQEPEVLSAQ